MSLRARIDNAFYNALDPQNRPSHDPVEAPGGFLLDENPGGFLPPSPPAAGHETGHGPERDEQFSYIPLSRIPHALQLLDLPPDDEEVLAVFRNAATGWEDDDSRRTAHRRKRDPTTTSEDNDVTEGRVSLRDWRAVCAAVLGEDGDDENDREGSSAINGDEILDATGDEDSSPEVEESSGGSSDEYRITETRSRKRSRKSAAATGGGAGATRKTRARKTQSATARRRSPLSPSTSAEITPRQRRECLKAFLLFFPGVPEEEAQRRRLGVREVNEAATVLKEKIKTEEVRPLTLGLRMMVKMCPQIIEMLEAFSTSPDKTMSLSDFEKLMITTRLA
jgi:hypothetical protein